MEEYADDFLNRFGNESIPNLVRQEASRLSNAYAVTSLMGSRPKQMLAETISAYNMYVRSEAGKAKFGTKNLERALITGTQQKTAEHILKHLCGNTQLPSGTGSSIARAVRSALAAPLLVNAGFKSFTDEGYRTIDAVNSGLMSRVDVRYWAPWISDFAQMFTNKEWREQLQLSTAFMQDTIMSSAAFKDASLPFVTKSKVGVNKYATAGDKVEAFLERFKDGVFKFTCVEQFTNFNRERFTATLFRAIGDKAEKSFDALLPEEQMLLRKHEIGAADWEILRRYCVKPLEEYAPGSKISSNYFLPDLVSDISDENLRNAMKQYDIYSSAKRKDIPDALVRRYRSELADKAGIMIDKAASDAVTLPNIRTRVALGGDDSSEVVKMLTQFMSFGMQTFTNHLKRSYAQHVNLETALGKNIIKDAFAAHPVKATMSLLEYFAYAGTITTLVNELLSGINGNHLAWIKDDGDINSEKLTWLARNYMEPFGVLNTVIDFLTSAICTGVSYVSVAPAAGMLGRMVHRAWRPVTSKSTEDDRGAAVSAALAQDLVSLTGIDRHPATAAVYNEFVGNTLEELSTGEDAFERKKRRREGKGYEASWVEYLRDR